MFADREKEILSTLEKLNELDFILIGGYAINAYTQPRFSVDCDIVVKNKQDAKKVTDKLVSLGYKEKEINPNIPYAGEFLCLTKEILGIEVPFDLLIGRVIDRKTKNKFDAKFIYENSDIISLTGKVTPKRIELRIANPEILIIMKLAASRKSDFRDVFMLLERDVDLNFILLNIKKYNLNKNLDEFKKVVTSDGFKDNLQGVFGKVDEKIYNLIINKINKIKMEE